MAVERTANRTRRELLAASVGGLAALLANAFGRPSEVRAGSDGDVVLDGTNTAADTTSIKNATTTKTVLHVENTVLGSIGLVAAGRLRGVHAFGSDAVTAEGDQYGIRASGGSAGVVGTSSGNGHSGVSGFADKDGIGVKGESDTRVGVYGRSDSGDAIYAETESGTGVVGSSSSGPGMLGASGSQTEPGVIGWSAASGVFGASGGSVALPTTPPVKTGVFGYAAQDATATGVHGRSTVGTGVHAQADAGGTALRVTGKAAFSRSGSVTVSAGRSSTTKSLTGITSSSLVFAVVRSGDGGVWVRKVVPASGSFTVYLNKAVSSSTSVIWIAFN
jgi:hypothetical protein